jgi:hypothetical protein
MHVEVRALPYTRYLLDGSESVRMNHELNRENPLAHGIRLRLAHLPLPCFAAGTLVLQQEQ